MSEKAISVLFPRLSVEKISFVFGNNQIFYPQNFNFQSFRNNLWKTRGGSMDLKLKLTGKKISFWVLQRVHKFTWLEFRSFYHIFA